MSYLIYVNGLGPNYKGDNIYEFIFGDSLDVWGDGWDSKPSNGNPNPPDLEHVKKIGVLKNGDITLNLIQNSDFFGIIDSVDDIIALAWEKDSDDINFDETKRLVFRFGEDEKVIKDKLYERDIVLEIEKTLKYETK